MNKKETTFERVKYIFIKVKIGDYITRRRLMNAMAPWYNEMSVDSYRNWFCHAGYFEKHLLGMYTKVKEIPKDLTSQQLRKEAYPEYYSNLELKCE